MPLHKAALIAGALALMATMAGAVETRVMVAGDDNLTETLRDSSRAIGALEGGNEDGTDRSAPLTPDDVVALAAADYRRLLATLYNAGYFAPVISIRINGREVADIGPFDRITRIDTLVYDVRTGPAFSFGTVAIGPLAPGDSLPEDVAQGQPARVSALEGAVSGALRGWRAQAHPKPRVTDERVAADNSAATLSATYRIEPGRTATFGRIGVTGANTVRESRVLQIAGIRSGKPFDPEVLAEAQRRLRQAGAFSGIAITEADSIGPDGALDLNINVTEAKPRRIGFGGDYSTTDGLTVTAFWLHRNMRNAAERLRFGATIENIGVSSGGTNYKFSGRYTRPATFTEDTDASIGFGAESLDQDTYQSDRAFFELGVDRYIDEKLDASLFLNYSYSDAEDAFGKRIFNVLALRARLRYDGRDDPGAATRGLYAEGRVAPFYSFGESVTGARMLFDGRGYRSLGDRLVLAGRAQLGSIVGAEIDQVPPEYLFYAGGGGSIRGFSYDSISVTLPDGKQTGGLSLAVFSAEARYSFTDTIGAVAFYDYGSVGTDSWIQSGDEWYGGAGIGARYTTPIGPLRVDIATPVQGGKSGSIELYIGIGEAF
jgi:translocation and assembly module TamA